MSSLSSLQSPVPTVQQLAGFFFFGTPLKNKPKKDSLKMLPVFCVWVKGRQKVLPVVGCTGSGCRRRRKRGGGGTAGAPTTVAAKLFSTKLSTIFVTMPHSLLFVVVVVERGGGNGKKIESILKYNVGDD